MIDLPMIPYIFFTFILVVGILIGTIRGWKATLFFSLGQIVSIGILIGIYAAVSKSIISLFRGWWIADLEVSGMDYSEILQLMKIPCGAVFVSVLLLPMNLVLWLIYLIFKKRINKYMEPKITDITQNSREVIPKSKKKTRIIGGVLGSIASFSVGSVVASGATFAFVKTDKMNWFTNMTDSISSASTFGQYQNTKSFKYVYDYMPILQKKKYIDNVIKLFSFTDGKGFNLSNKTLIEISAVNKDNSKLTKRVYGSADASYAVISTILSKSSATIEVIQDAVPSGNKGDRVAQDLKLFISSKHANMHFGIDNQKTLDVIKAALEKNFQTFDSTTWYKNYDDILKVIKAAKASLQKSIREFEARKTKLRSSILKRENDISSILTNHQKEQELTNHRIPGQKRIIVNWEQRKTDAQSDLNTAQSNLTAFTNGTWNGVLQRWNGYKNNVNTAKQTITRLNRDLQNTKNNLSRNQQEKSRLESLISDTRSQIDSLGQEINSLDQQIASAQSRKQLLAARLSQQGADTISINQQISSIDQQISDLNNSRQIKLNQLSPKQFTLRSITSQKSRVESDIRNDTLRIPSIEASLRNANIGLADANNDLSNYKSIYDSNKQELDLRKNNFNNAQNRFNQVSNRLSSEKTQLRTLLSEKNTALQNITNSKSHFHSMNQTISNLANGIDQLEDAEFRNTQLKDIDLANFAMINSYPLRNIGSKVAPTSTSASIRFQEINKIGKIKDLKTKNIKKDALKKIKDDRFKNYQENKNIILEQFIKLFKN